MGDGAGLLVVFIVVVIAVLAAGFIAGATDL